mgnify:CR=1 FL=1
MAVLINQVIVFLFNWRIPGTLKNRPTLNVHDQFILDTVTHLQKYEPAETCSFETCWLVKYQYSKITEAAFFENPVNSFLFLMFASGD